jgi:hypothetical protein
MSEARKEVHAYISADKYAEISKYAAENSISVSNAVNQIIDFFLQHKDAEVNDQNIYQQLTSYLDNYLVKQKQMIEGELKYFSKATNDITLGNIMYGHILNSMLWKMNCNERDYIPQNENSNPVFTHSYDHAMSQLKAHREKKISADKKYQDKAMSNGAK